MPNDAPTTRSPSNPICLKGKIMKFWQTVPFALAMAVLQAQTPAGDAAPQPTPTFYRVTLVQGSAKALNYRNLTHSTEIGLRGSVLAPGAKGEADVKSSGGAIHITAKVMDLPAASTFGPEYLTYVLWGISPEGRATNLGELVLKNGRGKAVVVEPLQTFGLVVTAEPYFAVSRPSDVVVMENVLGREAQGQVEEIDAHYDLLKRGQYTVNLTLGAPLVMDGNTPFEVYQARNAVSIARASGAAAYAQDPLGKAVVYLNEAEAEGGSRKTRIIAAREAVQRAEDARLIAVQRQDTERVATEEKWNQARLGEAKRKADQAVIAAANANTLVQVANQEAREANKETHAANLETQAANQQAQAAVAESAGLKTQLMTQLNTVLATRASARGLIVNMSGMLFQSGKATLEPAAREKLAKIAGILSTHKGLKIEAEGFTDNTGGDVLNQRLSEQRAAASRDYLVSQGVAPDAIVSRGFGKQNPIASNDTAQGRQENRRVELVVTGQGMAAGGSND